MSARQSNNDRARPVWDATRCMGCGWCMGHCPAKNQVITMVERKNGELVWNGRGVQRAWTPEN